MFRTFDEFMLLIFFADLVVRVCQGKAIFLVLFYEEAYRQSTIKSV